MAKEIITTDKVAKPRVPLSSAVKVGNLIFVSGMTPFTTDYQVAKGDFRTQMRQSMENIKAVLDAAGSSLVQPLNPIQVCDYELTESGLIPS